MAELLDFLTSPKGLLIANAIASILFMLMLLISWRCRTVSLGRRLPKIRSAERPLAFRLAIAALVLIAAWTGLAAAFQFFTRHY